MTSGDSPRRIAIVGGGASGVMVLLHLLRLAGPRRLEIHLIERSGVFGRGVAYARQPSCCLLNVPAAQLGVTDEEPLGFVRWLHGRGQPAAPTDFVPRALYGDFLEDTLAGALRAAPPLHRVHLLTTEAIGVERTSAGRLLVALSAGEPLLVDALVIASGNEPARAAVPGALSCSPCYLPNPWDQGALAAVAADARVLILGTGLTAMDVILTLQQKGASGPIVACSRRGLLPRVHQVSAPAGAAPLEATRAASGRGLSALLHGLRKDIRQAQSQGRSWHCVISALRPDTAEHWAALSARDRQRFLRHLRPYWEVHRHRMPPAVAQQIEALRAAGRLEVRAARHLDLRPAALAERFDVVINCTAPNRNSAETTNPLLRCAMEQGLLRADALGLGFFKGDGDLPIHLMGALCLGERWECTAIPELRAQAHGAALSILAAGPPAGEDGRWLAAAAPRVGSAAGSRRRPAVLNGN